MKSWVVTSLLGSLLVVMSCSTALCPMDTVVACNYVFYNADGEASALYDTLTVSIKKEVILYTYSKAGRNDSVLRSRNTALIDSGYTEKVAPARIDTVLVNKLINGTYMSVPMSYYNAVDTLVFSYKKILNPDTLYLFHTGYTHVETPECGSYRFHNLSGLRYTDRCIDRVEIINPTINYEGEKNVNIYFNTNSE